MSSLNFGKENVGGSNCISYGDQSPDADAVPLAWSAGDRRVYIGLDPNIQGWVCTVAGTPGTWVQIDYSQNTPILDVNYQWNWDWLEFNNNSYGAQATQDWIPQSEGGPVYNLFRVAGLGTLFGAIVPDRLYLCSHVARQSGAAAGANAVVSVVNSAGAIVGGGTATSPMSTAVGGSVLLDIPVADVVPGDALSLQVYMDAAANPLSWNVTWNLKLLKMLMF